MGCDSQRVLLLLLHQRCFVDELIHKVFLALVLLREPFEHVEALLIHLSVLLLYAQQIPVTTRHADDQHHKHTNTHACAHALAEPPSLAASPLRT